MKARTRRASIGGFPPTEPNAAFINIPYDKTYEPLYLAFIAGLSGFGLLPRAVLQIPGSQRRLDRILQLMCSCRYSFHDISLVALDTKRPPTPRFNMPFELGLAVAWQKAGDRKHRWFIFESRDHRQQKSLSDLNGSDIYIHDGRPIGVFRELTNALARTKHRPTVKELQAIYRDIRKASVKIKRNLAARSLFETRPFRELVMAARISAKRRIASLRTS